MRRKAELNLILNDVINGYSQFEYNRSLFFIKHLDIKIYSLLDNIYLNIYDSCVQNGIKNQEEKIQELINSGFWSLREEEEIKKIKLYLQGLNQSKSKQILVSQKRLIQKQIDEQERKLSYLLHNKYELLGLTAEYLADKEKNKFTLVKTIYKDEECVNPVFDEEYIDDELLSGLYSPYNKVMDNFTDRTFKCLALSDLFLMPFSLCENSVYNFFGKPAAKLTLYQNKLFQYGKKYLSIIEHESFSSIPIEVKEDPDKLIDWFEAKNSAKETLQKIDDKKSQGMSLVGATKEDLEALGIKQEKGIDFGAEAAKKGGSLSIWDIQKLQGES